MKGLELVSEMTGWAEADRTMFYAVVYSPERDEVRIEFHKGAIELKEYAKGDVCICMGNEHISTETIEKYVNNAMEGDTMKGENKAIQESRRVYYTRDMYYNLMYNKLTNEVWIDTYMPGDTWKKYNDNAVLCIKRGQTKLTRREIHYLVKKHKEERA